MLNRSLDSLEDIWVRMFNGSNLFYSDVYFDGFFPIDVKKLLKLSAVLSLFLIVFSAIS